MTIVLTSNMNAASSNVLRISQSVGTSSSSFSSLHPPPTKPSFACAFELLCASDLEDEVLL